jgi:hypothetical protein
MHDGGQLPCQHVVVSVGDLDPHTSLQHLESGENSGQFICLL